MSSFAVVSKWSDFAPPLNGTTSKSETAASQHSDTWHQTFFSTNSDQRLPLLIFDAWTFCLDGSAVIVSFLFDASGISQLQADYGQEAS